MSSANLHYQIIFCWFCAQGYFNPQLHIIPWSTAFCSNCLSLNYVMLCYENSTSPLSRFVMKREKRYHRHTLYHQIRLATFPRRIIHVDRCDPVRGNLIVSEIIKHAIRNSPGLSSVSARLFSSDQNLSKRKTISLAKANLIPTS